MRIFRWKYIVPRLLLLVVLFVVAEFGVGIAIKWSLENQGSTAVGAKVELAVAKASLLSTYVELHDLQIANPSKPLTNLLEADLVKLDFESGAVLRKKAVVDHGSITGLRFGGERETSGELPEAEPQEDSAAAEWLADAATERAKVWFENLEAQFTADVKEQFQSVQVANQLRDKWPGRYAALESQTKTVTDRIKQLQEQVKQAKQNPLRHIDFLQRVPAEIQQLTAQIQSLSAELDRLPNEIAGDRRTIAQARQHDEQLIREKLSVDALDPDALSAYLLNEQVAGPMGEMLRWLVWARQLMPAKVEQAPIPGRGINVLFAGSRKIPDLLVRSLDLQGAAQVSGQPLELIGTVTDFTTQPWVHGKPMKLALTTSGGLPMEINATVDRPGEVAIDTLVADCQGIVLPEMSLGKQDKFGLAVGASAGTVNISLRLDGDRLTGDVQMVQEGVVMTPSIKLGKNDKLGTDAISQQFEQSLTHSLSRLPKLVTRVNLTGTLKKPEWKVWSTLGPAVAQAMQTAVTNSVDAQADRLIAKSREQVDAQLAAVDAEFQQATAKLGADLGQPSELIKQLSGGLLNNNKSPFGAIGSLPGFGNLKK